MRLPVAPLLRYCSSSLIDLELCLCISRSPYWLPLMALNRERFVYSPSKRLNGLEGPLVNVLVIFNPTPHPADWIVKEQLTICCFSRCRRFYLPPVTWPYEHQLCETLIRKLTIMPVVRDKHSTRPNFQFDMECGTLANEL